MSNSKNNLAELISLLEGADISVSKIILTKLGSIDDPIATKTLIENLTFNNIDVRLCAIRALNCLALRNPREELVAPAITALKDENENIRYEAAGVLSNLPYESAERGLIDALNEKDSDVIGIIVFALGKVGSEKVIPTLDYIAQHDERLTNLDFPISFLAQQALQEIKAKFKG